VGKIQQAIIADLQ